MSYCPGSGASDSARTMKVAAFPDVSAAVTPFFPNFITAQIAAQIARNNGIATAHTGPGSGSQQRFSSSVQQYVVVVALARA